MLAGTCFKISIMLRGLEKIEKIFKEKWNFPHCVSAVDGKHIEVIGCDMGSQYTKAQTQLFF